MNLIHKKMLQQKINTFEFPSNEKFALAKDLLEKWKKALKDSDLEKTKENKNWMYIAAIMVAALLISQPSVILAPEIHSRLSTALKRLLLVKMI